MKCLGRMQILRAIEQMNAEGKDASALRNVASNLMHASFFFFLNAISHFVIRLQAYPLYLDLITLVPDHEAQTEIEQLIRTHLVYH